MQEDDFCLNFYTDVRNTNLDDRNAVADLQAVADVGLNTRRIVRCNSSTLNTPYKAGLTGAGYGTAYIGMISVNSGTIFYVCDSFPRAFLRSKDGGSWGDWVSLTTSADITSQSITNSYGLSIDLLKFGNENLKVIKITGYVNKALTAGTEYTIATNTAIRSRINWYHNVYAGVKGANLVAYIRIDTDGNIKITPNVAVASGAGISIMEYYI